MVREQGGHVAVGRDPEEHQVEPRQSRLEVAADQGLVLPRRLLRIVMVCRHWVDVLRRDGDAVEKRQTGQPVVAARVIGRHVSLVAPEEVNPRPRDRRREAFGKELIHTARRASPRQPRGTAALPLHRRRDRVGQRSSDRQAE